MTADPRARRDDTFIASRRALREHRTMPEGPEIRRVAERLSHAIGGDVATQVSLTLPALTRFEPRLRGRVVESISPRGKALLTRFEGGLTLFSHNQLYGLWIVSRGASVPRTTRSLRVVIAGARATIRLYSASDIDVIDAAGLARHPYLSRLGPDLLDAMTTPAMIDDRLSDKRFSGRSLAALLLDQSFVAGIGNYLRSEMLFVAGLVPERRPRDLAPHERAALAEAIVRVGHQAWRLAGVTNDPQRAGRMKLEGIGFEARRFRVFDREGLPCHDCGEPIERLDAGRRIYVCRTCQR
jgi:endonuclease-8